MFQLLLISLTLLFGESETPLEIWMEDKILNNRKLNFWGVWEVEYRGYKYTTINYKTEPHTYIHWESLDSFYVNHFGRIYPTSIINPLTCSRRDGSGKQTLYLNEDMIGETYTIYGCVEGDTKTSKEDNFEGCGKLKFKVK